MQTYKDLNDKIRELGGELDEAGINWQWAMFPSTETATEFHNWLDSGWETRGVYPETAKDLAGVRFRRA